MTNKWGPTPAGSQTFPENALEIYTGQSMIFAEIEYPEEYWDFHEELNKYLLQHFENVESGLQTDSWFWIKIGKHKIALDTFSSMKHQVKSTEPGSHVQQVVSALQEKYKVTIYAEPELEGHEISS